MTKDDIVQQLKTYIPFTSHSEVEQCAEDILQQHNKEMQRLLQQTSVSGGVQPNSEPTKECGTCWGGGKIDVDDDMRTVDCWACGGSGRVKL